MYCHSKTPMPKLPRWNWGAFLLTWIWGVGNRVWISLLALIPVVNIGMAVYLGLNGNRLAWQRCRYLSVSEFKMIQKLWLKWGVAILIILTFFGLAWLLMAGYLAHESDEMAARDEQRKMDVKIIASRAGQFRADHSGFCPDKLEQIAPDYISSIPLDPMGSSYIYETAGNSCTVSAVLENGEDANLLSDADPLNANIFDQNIENFSDYIFYEE